MLLSFGPQTASCKIGFIRQIQTDGLMDKADKKQISRHTSICISSSYHLSFSLIHIQMHTLVVPVRTQTTKDELKSAVSADLHAQVHGHR